MQDGCFAVNMRLTCYPCKQPTSLAQHVCIPIAHNIDLVLRPTELHMTVISSEQSTPGSDKSVMISAGWQGCAFPCLCCSCFATDGSADLTARASTTASQQKEAGLTQLCSWRHLCPSGRLLSPVCVRIFVHVAGFAGKYFPSCLARTACVT